MCIRDRVVGTGNYKDISVSKETQCWVFKRNKTVVLHETCKSNRKEEDNISITYAQS